MADFKAVLRKTLDGLGETTPEIREKVYEKARAAIRKKLEAIEPKPAQAVIDRQMQSLEDAIKEVESDHKVAEEPTDEPLDELDRLLGTPPASTKAAPAPEPPAADPTTTIPATSAPLESPVDDTADYPSVPGTEDGDPAAALPGSDMQGDQGLERAAETIGRVRAKKKSRKGLWFLLFALLLGAAAAAAWIRNDLVEAYTGFDPRSLLPASMETMAPDDSATSEEPPAEESSQPPTEETTPDNSSQAEPPAEDTSGKFTQRLTADGKEIDPGPAAEEPSVGEGTSVATAVPPQDGPSATETPATADTGTPATSETPSVAVGQKALLYEEGSGSDQGTADAGSVIWSVVQESPADNLPAEPAIRGEMTIPEKGINLTITIRRNGDKTLPASHLVELYFQMPGGYGGGGVAELTRISMKETEQSTGSPLLGVPARISDEFYLVALTEAQAAIDTNITLLRRQNWIDIPVSYLSGRRALFTLEKGVPGERVFNEVLKAWQDSQNG